jgi:hypothetical protein
MREKLDENWKPIGVIASKIVADIERKQREQDRDCQKDGVLQHPAKVA